MHDALTLVKAEKSSSWRTNFELCVECWRRWRAALRSYSWGGLWRKMVAWYCLASACTTIAARPRNWTWLIKWYTSSERTLRSAAPNANYVSTGASVTYHLGTWNLASCKFCFSIISSYCSGHMISMGTGSLGWQSVQKLTGFHFNVATCGYKALHSTRENCR